MTFSINVTAKGLVPKISSSQINGLLTAGMKTLAVNWHAEYSQFKFTPAAARKYGYTKRRTKEVRTGKIKRGKRGGALAPNGNPLTWTGASRLLAKQKTFRASSVESSVTSPIRAFNFKPKGAWPGLDMRKEYKTVLPGEQRSLGRKAEKALRNLFSKNKKNINVIFSRTI